LAYNTVLRGAQVAQRGQNISRRATTPLPPTSCAYGWQFDLKTEKLLFGSLLVEVYLDK